jgi:hypothetical protein
MPDVSSVVEIITTRNKEIESNLRNVRGVMV